MKTRGFTLVEMVMVIIVVGTLATVALPRMLDITMWRLRAYGDELLAQSLAMQRLSLAQRRTIVATINTTGVAFAYGSGTAIVTVSCPAAVTPCISEAGPRTVTFNSSNTGSVVTSTGSALPVTVASGTYSKAFQIESETGLFHALP